MTPDRWRKLQEVYFNVTVLEPNARVAFLDETCRGDWEMRQEVDSLLDCESKIGRLLEHTAIETLVAEYGADLVQDEVQSHTTLIGAIIDDRYLVREHIGSGGAGDVYRAVHRLLDTPVA